MSIRPVRVVVVAYHGADDLFLSLNELAHSFEVIVVDNSNSVAVREVAERSGAIYTCPGQNLGFAGGVNAALRRIIADDPSDVLLLNPDAILTANDLDALAAELHRRGNERIGAISPQLVDADGNDQRVLWPFPSPLGLWIEAIGLGRLLNKSGFAIGAVLLLRWEALQEVGLFDERYFLYAEETDWQRRATNLGWRSRLYQDVVARHVGAATSDDPRRREILFHAAQEIYVRKWYGPVGWFAYRVAACVGATGRLVVLTGERRAEAGRRAALYLRGPRRCESASRS